MTEPELEETPTEPIPPEPVRRVRVDNTTFTVHDDPVEFWSLMPAATCHTCFTVVPAKRLAAHAHWHTQHARIHDTFMLKEV